MKNFIIQKEVWFWSTAIICGIMAYNYPVRSATDHYIAGGIYILSALGSLLVIVSNIVRVFFKN
jgi:hypothetical protein